MLTDARPIFREVPASFADPAGLALQQAPGVVALVVVRYRPAPGPEAALGHVYDAYVAASGQLLAVARTTADYRYTVTPSVALARFFDDRDGGRSASLSLFEVTERDCTRFLETAYFAECLKLHVEGPASAALVARQLAQSGCGDALPSGLLEINDFSDPGAPRVHLLDLEELGAPDAPHALVDVLSRHLDGVVGRALLYDREKNRAALPHRSAHPVDLGAAIDEANRLALARPAPLPATAPPPAEPRDAETSVAVERVENALRDTTEARPTAGLAALVAELQGRGPAPAAADVAGPPGPPAADVDPDPSPQADAETAGPAPSDGARRHPLATELDVLRADVYALFEEAVGRDRAAGHEAHVLDTVGLDAPVPPDQTLAYLRALLTADPPRRWHLFKRARAKTFEVVCGKLLAFHAANGHVDDPVIHEVNKLWARLCR